MKLTFKQINRILKMLKDGVKITACIAITSNGYTNTITIDSIFKEFKFEED